MQQDPRSQLGGMLYQLYVANIASGTSETFALDAATKQLKFWFDECSENIEGLYEFFMEKQVNDPPRAPESRQHRPRRVEDD